MQASEKEEFKKYLEKTGVIDALTKVLVGLYEESEKPPNAIDWISKHINSNIGTSSFQELDALRKENEELKKEKASLREENSDLKKKLQELQKQ